MPATTESPYQADLRQRRTNDRQAEASRSLVRKHRSDVETVISLDNKAGVLEKQLSAFDQEDGDFRRRVQEDRTAWWLRVIFWGSIALYVVAEFMTSGDVSEWLANQIAPLFQVDVNGGDTPVWLRRVAGGAFVGTMLGVTLLLKFVTTWFRARFSEERANVQVGEDALHRNLTAGIWMTQLAKVVYLAGVAVLYVWLFGFAQERAAITAAIATEQQQSLQWTDLGIKLEGGTIETDEAVAKSTSAAPPAAVTGSKLSWATGVLYVMLCALHGLVLLLPTDGFGRELELAHFKKVTAERDVRKIRETEGRIHRDNYERIMAVQGEDRDALIRETLPVARQMNKALGRVVIVVPQTPGDTGMARDPNFSEAMPPTNGTMASAAEGAPSQEPATNHNDAAPQDAASATGNAASATGSTTNHTGNGTNGSHPGAEPEDFYRAIFGSRS